MNFFAGSGESVIDVVYLFPFGLKNNTCNKGCVSFVEVSPAEIRREAEVKAGITKTLKEALQCLQQQHSTRNYVIQR